MTPELTPVVTFVLDDDTWEIIDGMLADAEWSGAYGHSIDMTERRTFLVAAMKVKAKNSALPQGTDSRRRARTLPVDSIHVLSSRH